MSTYEIKHLFHSPQNIALHFTCLWLRKYHSYEILVYVIYNNITELKDAGRAQDPHANGAWLSKLFILGGQRIDQKSKKGW